MQVKRLATGEVWAHSATAGVRDFGAANAGLNVFAAKTTKLTDLTDGAGTSLGLAVGQTISLSGLQGGTPVTSATAVHGDRVLDARRPQDVGAVRRCPARP